MDPNLFITIARHNNFHDFLAFIHVSRRVRRIFLLHLEAIVGHVLKTTLVFNPETAAPTDWSKKLPRWVTLTLPLMDIPGSQRQALNDHVVAGVQQKYPFLLDQSHDCHELMMNPCRRGKKSVDQPRFLAGGSVAQIAHDKEWRTDLDLFRTTLPGEVESREKVWVNLSKRHSGGPRVVEIDSIAKDTQHIEWTLSDFDLSVCQIGVLLSPDTSGVTGPRVFVTPLFLYSLHTRSLIAQVSDVAAKYRDDFKEGITAILDTFFKKHCDLHRQFCKFDQTSLVKTRFDECDSCYYTAQNLLERDNNDPPIISGDDGADNFIHRWIDRVRKYVGRFPDFDIKYIKAV
uniref:Uncharacterized protein n=1 Tax=viral metagenome TaxID=1070528 RepID=A0A6C0BNZ4_9ZZZZ